MLQCVAMTSSPGNLPNPESEPTSLMSPALARGFFIPSATWEALGKCEPNNTPELQPRRQSFPSKLAPEVTPCLGGGERSKDHLV